MKMMNRKNIGNAVFISLVLVILFIPSAKALMIRGLMEIGLFRPDIQPVNKSDFSTDLSGIQFKDQKGKVTDLGTLKGKVIFLNFWATWCPPCLAEMPAINKLYEQFKDDENFVFILVDADGNFEKSQKYMNKKGYKMPVYTVNSDIPEGIFSGSLPTTLVFDKMGRVSYNESGAANYANKKFVTFLKELKNNNL